MSTANRSDSVTRVYQQLRGLIIVGQLAPGSRIAERAVAERLGLSRTPVRSALHRLQQEGFVASYGRGGDQRLVVTPLTQDDGREIMRLVGHLEGMAARFAAELALPRRTALVRRLRALNRSLAAESRRRTPATRIFDLDHDFHNEYVEEAAGPRLLALHHAVKPQVERYARLYVSHLVDEIETSVREHDAIIRAIGRGDSEAAQLAVEANWRNAGDRLAKVVDQQGERGIWHVWSADTDSPAANGRKRHRK